ncbi:hypothetical protein WJX74_003393 [Apatococcus lobatus]|uniref:Uncharacterized protein n=1 Tax=Apatococcus lobatus TaxID=904363 RepID=A0AAW1Q5N6_9CHLO
MARKRKQPETPIEADRKDEGTSDPGVSAKAAANVADSLASSKYTGPFENFERPTEQECREAREGLAKLHGEPMKADINEREGQD